MYIVNGVANTIVWKRTVQGFTQSRAYRVRLFAASAHSANPAQLRIGIPGGTTGATVTLPTTTGVWVPVDLLFTAGSTQVTIEVRDMLQTAQGNDFVIDDIEITDVATGARIMKDDFEVITNYIYKYPAILPDTTPPEQYPLWDERTYTLAASPRDTHKYFYAFGNHTTGGAKMMVVNGVQSTTVWARTISGLTQGQPYTIRAYAATAYPANPAVLQWSVVGVGSGSQVNLPLTTGQWVEVSQTFNAPGPQVTVSLSDLLPLAGGNDFVVDDIELVAAAPPPPSYGGAIDGLNCTTITGWAIDFNRQATSIPIKVYDGNTLAATVAADIYRPDLFGPDYPATIKYHGFSFQTPTVFRNGSLHSISLKFEDSAVNLPGSPTTIQCVTAQPATLTSPSAGSTLPSGLVTFQWNTGTGASQYILNVGSADNGFDLFTTGNTTSLAATTDVPDNGQPVYVTLWSLTSSGWLSTKATYVSAFSQITLTSSASAQYKATAYADGEKYSSSYTVDPPVAEYFSECSVSGYPGVAVTLGSHAGSHLAVTAVAQPSAAPGRTEILCKFDYPGQPRLVLALDGGLTVFDSTPRIDSITPSTVSEGDVDVPVTFTGVGFGNVPPILTFSPPGMSARIAPGSTPTQFTAYVTPANSGIYEVTVTSGGYSGFFAPGPASNSQNNTGKAISVAPGSRPEILEVKVNGTPISSGARVVLPAGTMNLAFAATLTGEGVAGYVTFRLSASYKDPKQGVERCPLPFQFDVASGTVDVGAAWTVDLGTGGNIILEWSLNGGPFRRDFTFQVVGENPDRGTLLQELGDTPWYLKPLIGVESSNPPVTPYHNFYPEDYPFVDRRGQPVWGTPCGYGVMQLDPPRDVYAIFRWRLNIQQGKNSKLAEKITTGDNWWTRQTAQWQAFMSKYGVVVPMQADKTEAQCVFSANPVGTQHHFRDALAIKCYNNCNPHYISYTGTADSLGVWKIQNIAIATINNEDVPINEVERTCSFIP